MTIINIGQRREEKEAMYIVINAIIMPSMLTHTTPTTRNNKFKSVKHMGILH